MTVQSVGGRSVFVWLGQVGSTVGMETPGCGKQSKHDGADFFWLKVTEPGTQQHTTGGQQWLLH